MTDIHDVIVGGSGAGGGIVTHVLTQAGLKVLMLEAGRDFDPVAETPRFDLPSATEEAILNAELRKWGIAV